MDNDDQGLRILLVDDDEEDYILTRSKLTKLGDQQVRLEWADSFDAGRIKLSTKTYDVVLMDYNLGGCVGTDLIREFRDQQEAPFILFTGLRCDDLESEAFQAGASNLLNKAEADEALLEWMIRDVIQDKKMNRAM